MAWEACEERLLRVTELTTEISQHANLGGGALQMTLLSALPSRASKFADAIGARNRILVDRALEKLLQRAKEARLACAGSKLEDITANLLEEATKLEISVGELPDDLPPTTTKQKPASAQELKAQLARLNKKKPANEKGEEKISENLAQGEDQNSESAQPTRFQTDTSSVTILDAPLAARGTIEAANTETAEALASKVSDPPAIDSTNESLTETAGAELEGPLKEEKATNANMKQAEKQAEEEERIAMEKAEAEERRRLRLIWEAEERAEQAKLNAERKAERERAELLMIEAKRKADAKAEKDSSEKASRARLVRAAREVLQKEVRMVDVEKGRGRLQQTKGSDHPLLVVKLQRPSTEQQSVMVENTPSVAKMSNPKVPDWKRAALLADRDARKQQMRREDGVQDSLPALRGDRKTNINSWGRRKASSDGRGNLAWWRALDEGVTQRETEGRNDLLERLRSAMGAKGGNDASVASSVAEVAALSASKMRRRVDTNSRVRDDEAQKFAEGLADEVIWRRVSQVGSNPTEVGGDCDTMSISKFIFNGASHESNSSSQNGSFFGRDVSGVGKPIINLDNMLVRRNLDGSNAAFLVNEMRSVGLLSDLEREESSDHERFRARVELEKEARIAAAQHRAGHSARLKKEADAATQKFLNGEVVGASVKRKKEKKGRGRLATLILGVKTLQKQQKQQQKEQETSAAAAAAAAASSSSSSSPHDDGIPLSQEINSTNSHMSHGDERNTVAPTGAMANSKSGGVGGFLRSAARRRRVATFQEPDEPEGAEQLGPGGGFGTIKQLLDVWVWLNISRAPEHAGGPVNMDPGVCATLLRRKNVAPPLPEARYAIVQRARREFTKPKKDAVKATGSAPAGESLESSEPSNGDNHGPEARELPEVQAVWNEQIVQRAMEIVKLVQICSLNPHAKKHILAVNLRDSASFSGTTPIWSQERSRMETEYAKLCATSKLEPENKNAAYGKVLLSSALQRPEMEVAATLKAAVKLFPQVEHIKQNDDEGRIDSNSVGTHDARLVYEHAMLDLRLLCADPSSHDTRFRARSRFIETIKIADNENTTLFSDERQLLLRCRLELASLHFDELHPGEDNGSGKDDPFDGLEWELLELLRLHSPPADRYDGAILEKPLPECDEIRCMLAQLYLRRNNFTAAQSYYRLLGSAGLNGKAAYPANRRFIPWAEPGCGIAWVNGKSDDMAT